MHQQVFDTFDRGQITETRQWPILLRRKIRRWTSKEADSRRIAGKAEVFRFIPVSHPLHFPKV